MNIFNIHCMSSVAVVLTLLFIITSDLSVVSYIRITFRRISWHHFLQKVKGINIENTFGGFGSRILEDTTSRKPSSSPEYSACEFLLGILTIPDNILLRNASRHTWIKVLPENVCYVFLYDKPDYISPEEKFDGTSLNVKHEGKGIRFGEKLYRFFNHVHNNRRYKNVKYVVKMDDDVVLCPERLFPFLKDQNISSRTYAGWFHNIDMDLGYNHRADEMFILIGRFLMDRIASKRYCQHRNEKACDSLGHIFDTNYGGTSLGIWLSKMNDVKELHLNKFVEDLRNSNVSSNTKDTLLFHPTKTVEKIKEKYSNC